MRCVPPGPRLSLIFGAIVLIFFVGLSGCNFFYHSAFPGYVPLIQNQVDISNRFPYDPAAEYRVEVVNGGAGDYVIILAAGPALGERLAIYDADLKEQFYRKDTVSADEFGRDSPVIINALGDLFVGRLQFGPGLSAPSIIPGTVTLSGENNVFIAPTDYISVSRSDLDEVNFKTATPTIDTAPADNLVDVGLLGDLQAVTASYSPAIDYFGFAAFDRNSRQIVVWVRPLTGWAFPAVDIASEPQAGVFPTSVSDVQRMKVMAQGVVIEQEEDGLILRFYDLFGNEGDSLSLSHGDARYAFSAAGTHFYLLRSEEEKLVKADTWW